MGKPTPVVYILHGEDEFGIAKKLAEFERLFDDPGAAAMNTIRLEGGAFQPERLMEVAGALPFLAKRRLVIVFNPTSRLGTKEARQKFMQDLEQIPATTALVLCEDRLLTVEREGEKDTRRWLEKWAQKNPERAWIRAFPPPKGGEWAQSIQNLARQEGGQISPQTSVALYELTNGDLRLAAQEVKKLLAYVNYSRPIQLEDALKLTADVGQGDIFAMVDALGNRDRRRALGMLRRLLDYLDYYAIFGMTVRQFRQIAQTRAILDAGKDKAEVIRVFRLFDKKAFLADRLIGQARHFSIAELRLIYHRLLETDEAVKTSQMPGDLALEMLVASLTD
ncbi:MAG: DNA polymerase III subunit delta [Anaerolineae bacterium UTCFX2]|jgi:DNA polymerase-3 subunit delta|nr:DNA polymerase III subunit delta [Anaerolineales bacterium]OQY93023.1 MAG: DNA polymerase III subunit delta [Anaerolineae bacterium UTCFX2]